MYPDPIFTDLLNEQDPNSYVRKRYGLGYRDALLPARLAGGVSERRDASRMLTASAVIDPGQALRQLKAAEVTDTGTIMVPATVDAVRRAFAEASGGRPTLQPGGVFARLWNRAVPGDA